jgi:glycine cleavage system H protein
MCPGRLQAIRPDETGRKQMYPDTLRYTKGHEWVRVEGDICVIGITHYAQDELGEVVFVEVPEPGQEFDAHEEIGTIESVKAVAEVFIPVAGEIVEANEALVDSPELINQDPHGEGWLVKVRFTSQDDLDVLMNAEAYAKFLEDGE